MLGKKFKKHVSFLSALEQQYLVSPMSSKILFVGWHNTSNARFAEGYFNSSARQNGLRWKAAARGLRTQEAITRINPELEKSLSSWDILPQDLAAAKLPLTVRDLMSHQKIILWSYCEAAFQQQFPNWHARAEIWEFHSKDFSEQNLLFLAEKIDTLLAQISGKEVTNHTRPPLLETSSLTTKSEATKPEAPNPTSSTATTLTPTNTPSRIEKLETTQTRTSPESSPEKKQDSKEQRHAENIAKLATLTPVIAKKHTNRLTDNPRPTKTQNSPTPQKNIEKELPFQGVTELKPPSPQEKVPLSRAVKAALRLKRSL